MMILLIIGLALVYFSSFADLYEESTSSEEPSPFSESTRQHMLFLFFWAGVFSDLDYETYSQSVYPFYILMVLLICERLAQLWLETRFGCSDAIIRKFKQIEKQDAYYKSLARERKKASERLLHASRRMRRTRSRMSMVSATGSQVSDGVSNNSFCTDEDMRESGKPEGKSLLTIKEESGNENESTLKRSARAQVLTESVLSSQLDSVAEGLGKFSHKNASVVDGKANDEPGSGHTSINAS